MPRFWRRLQTCQVRGEVCDPLPYGDFISLVQVQKYRTPHRHRQRPVRRQRSPEEDIINVGVRELAVMALCERGQIGRRKFEVGCDGALPFSVGAMATGAILFVHLLAGGYVRRGKLAVTSLSFSPSPGRN